MPYQAVPATVIERRRCFSLSVHPIKKSVLLAAAAVFALSAGSATASPRIGVRALSGEIYHPYLLPTQIKGAKTLWDQNDEGEGYAVPSDFYDSGSYDEYDAEGADDFTVPKGQTWTVQEVDVSGVDHANSARQRSSRSESMDAEDREKTSDGQTVYFYEDSKGAPGKNLAEIQTSGKDDGLGNLAISLGKKGIVLGSGTYWVSVQVKTNYEKGEYAWYWSTRKKQEGNPAMWENPGGGYGAGKPCDSWKAVKSCWRDGGVDFLFALKGVSK